MGAFATEPLQKADRICHALEPGMCSASVKYAPAQVILYECEAMIIAEGEQVLEEWADYLESYFEILIEAVCANTTFELKDDPQQLILSECDDPAEFPEMHEAKNNPQVKEQL